MLTAALVAGQKAPVKMVPGRAPRSGRGTLVEPKLKLILSTSPEMFEQRLNDFLASLDKNDLIVDVKFATTPFSNSIEYSALVHYQATTEWDD